MLRATRPALGTAQSGTSWTGPAIKTTPLPPAEGAPSLGRVTAGRDARAGCPEGQCIASPGTVQQQHCLRSWAAFWGEISGANHADRCASEHTLLLLLLLLPDLCQLCCLYPGLSAGRAWRWVKKSSRTRSTCKASVWEHGDIHRHP